MLNRLRPGVERHPFKKTQVTSWNLSLGIWDLGLFKRYSGTPEVAAQKQHLKEINYLIIVFSLRMSLLLTHGYFLHEDPREKLIMKPYPPLGILYISSFLQKSKIEHDVFDSTFSSFEILCEQIVQNKYKQIGIYVNLMTKVNVLKLIFW